MTTNTLYLIPLAAAVYYACAWLLLAREPKAESIVVCYHPPAGLSPAAIRYIATSACDGRTFVAVLARLASYKLLEITPEKTRRTSCLNKLQSDRQILQQLSEEERIVFQHVFEWQDRVELEVPDARLMEKVLKSLQAQLGKYITKNHGAVVGALVLSAAATAWMCLALGFFGVDRLESFIMAGFTGLTVALFAAAAAYLWDSNLLALKLALRGLYHRRVLILLATVILLFPAMWFLLIRTVAVTFANVTGLLILVNMLAAPLLRSYTPAGWQILHQIQGFRQFIQRAEQDRLQRLNHPGEEIQADHQYVSYAIALDVREDWGDRIAARIMLEARL